MVGPDLAFAPLGLGNLGGVEVGEEFAPHEERRCTVMHIQL
jgi:hypothetical protein